MLRRRKEDVESELPGRTTKTFFVPMTDAQTSTFEDYDLYVKRLAALAARRPLTKEEFERLQKYLACMRMICDTPWILGDENRDCPKMEEMERLLPDLLDDPERKIIVFSEWVRMLELVREYAGATGIEFAWHTGSVPQPQRRAESTDLNVKVIDPATHESMLRLAEAGLIALPGGELREVWPASAPERSESDGRILRAKALTGRAEHKLKAAVLLVGGGFAEEALAPAVDSARLAVAALAAMRGKPEPGDAESAAEFLLGEEPDGIPDGRPHDAIRALSGDEPEDGEVARIEEFVSRISWMVTEMSAPSRGAAA